MKKLNGVIIVGLFFALIHFSSTLKAQTRVETIDQLQNEVGYSVGRSVYLGNGVYRASVYLISNGKCKGRGRKCKQCAGCCNSGYVEFDAQGRIISITNNVDDNCNSIPPTTGQMYYDSEGDWIQN
jgi:hypothetical protein